MKLACAPVDYDYIDYEGRNYIRMIGRSGEGKRVCVLDSYEPNFYVILKKEAKKKDIDSLIADITKITVEKDSRTTTVEKVERVEKNFLSEKVSALQVYVTNHKDMHAVASEIGDSPIVLYRRGYDINIITKYIMQGGLEPLQYYEIEGSVLAEDDFGGIVKGLDVDICVKLDKAQKQENAKKFEPKVLSFDIESEIGDVGSGEVYMIGLYGRDFTKVITWKSASKKHSYVETVKDEKEMITRFIESVKEYDPDVLCGYFSDGYDLAFLRERAKKYKMKLTLGLDHKDVSFSRGGGIASGKMCGIVHVDIYKFIASAFSQYLSGESLSLNDVASELVGEMKGDFDFTKLSKMTQQDWEDFFAYNFRDVEVTYKLFNAIWTDLYEFATIIKEPLFAISRNTMATDVELYVLHNLNRFNEIPEKNPTHHEIGERRSKQKFAGAFVYEPTPGLYTDVVMIDFTSMYGSVIVTYNLSRSTFVGGKEDNYTFSKKQGFFPILLSEIIDMRKKYKKEYALKKDNMSKARSNGYKLLANAAYGYQAFFGARYHSREAASSTARLAKDNILSVIDSIKKEGYDVLYSDTDSVAFLQGGKKKKEVLSFIETLNKNLPGIMEIDIEGFYPRAVFVSKRGGGSGAKKKYALIDEHNELKIRGFETVRRDWCTLARKLQNNILQLILQDKEQEAEEELRHIVEQLKNRKIPLEELIIKTQLRKGINDYVATGPHVAAAKRMEEKGVKISPGMLITYYVSEASGNNKKGKARNTRIGDRVKLPDEDGAYDIEYYLHNQILPAVENIFEVLDVSVVDILNGQTQKGLFDFG